MTRFFRPFLMMALCAMLAAPAFADDASSMPDRVLGKTNAPILVDEYVSLTCSHCAEFYNTTLPELEKRYVDNGKVRFILHDFPLDGIALKAAQLARCMPADEYYPFVKTLYASQTSWAMAPQPDTVLLQYAKLGGLSDDKAKACLADTKLQDAIIAERTTASEKLGIAATPTFVVNGTETLKGAQSADNFALVFDRLLAGKK
jgi:protein-disulfide isomerase